MKDILLVVLGYGCYLNAGMREYLNSVIDFVNVNEVTRIITTGGFTNPNGAPGVSEAGMMAKYLSKNISTPIILEENARTTTENLKGVKSILQQNPELTHCNIVIFCDSCRSLKVKIIARSILKLWPRVIACDLTKRISKKMKQLFVATPLDVVALWVPFLEKMEIKRREKRNKNL
ncbi:hypothetical protein B6D52_00990 [Candidatus Parcubacteria bacterium 4484_255]|nr:MAG: hypothetical protein B6D52_00990 [Candidatus Parcubacteria bacterium 4484_255]